MEIDILCPLYNASKYFENFINCILKQKNVKINKFIFPVTKSNDNTFALAKKVTNAIVYEVDKKDFSHSLTREEAMHYAESNIVIFLSQDVLLEDENALHNLAKEISDNVIYSFSKQISKDKGIEQYIRKINYPNESYVVEKKDIDRLQIKAFFSSDACAAYNRKKFLELKGYDGKKMEVSEDMYYCRKVLLAGYSTSYCSNSIVVHSHKLTLKQIYKRYYDIGVFFRDNPEFNEYKSTNSGMKLACRVFFQCVIHFDLISLIKFIPNMVARFLGKIKGQRKERKNKI